MRGHGTMTWPGGRYEGEFRDSDAHGRGTFTRSDGTRYEGEFRDSRLWRGHVTKRNDKKYGYEGEFRDGKMHGRGTSTLSDGSCHKVHYNNGKLLSAKRC